MENTNTNKSGYIPLKTLAMELEFDADNRPNVWQLYTPEPDQRDLDPNMYLWVRRCNLFASYSGMLQHLYKIGIKVRSIAQHEDFRELLVIKDQRNYVWYACPAPIYD